MPRGYFDGCPEVPGGRPDFLRAFYLWAPPGTSGHLRAPLGTSGHLRAPPGTSGHLRAPPATSGYLWAPPGTSGHLQASIKITSEHAWRVYIYKSNMSNLL